MTKKNNKKTRERILRPTDKDIEIDREILGSRVAERLEQECIRQMDFERQKEIAQERAQRQHKKLLYEAQQFHQIVNFNATHIDNMYNDEVVNSKLNRYYGEF